MNIIDVSPGYCADSCKKAVSIVRDANFPIFKRNGKLVRISGKSIVEVDVFYLSYILSSSATFKRSGSKIDCPEKLCKMLLAIEKWDSIQELHGLTTVPILRQDGSLHSTPGYDPISKMFLVCDHNIDVPEECLSQKEAKIAIKTLCSPFEEFPFSEDISLSVSISALMTGLIRSLLPSAPLHAFSAPKMATGKSLLCACISLIVKGEECGVFSQAPNEGEEEKRLLSILMSGDSVVCIDNVEKPFSCSALCSILTEPFYKGRILGKSQHTDKCSTNILFLMNGNNLCIKGDLSSRTILCSLDSKMEAPEGRSFKKDVKQYIRKNRNELISTALNILRSYQKTTKKINIPPYGRFELWGKMVREAIIWCGLPDPCLSRMHVEGMDPVRNILIRVLHSWYVLFGERPSRIRAVVDHLNENKSVDGEIILECFKEISGSDVISTRIVGRFFMSHHRRIERGLMLCRNGCYQNSEQWSVKKVRKHKL